MLNWQLNMDIIHGEVQQQQPKAYLLNLQLFSVNSVQRSGSVVRLIFSLNTKPLIRENTHKDNRQRLTLFVFEVSELTFIDINGL